MAKILVIDSDHDTTQLLQHEMEQRGYGVVLTQTGFEGIKIAQQGFALIILDVLIPDMDGLEVIRKLKGDNKTADIPLIIATLKDSEVDEVTALELGVIDYIRKPIRITAFLARVRGILQRFQDNNQQEHQAPETINIGDLTLNVPNFSLYVAGQEVLFAKKEFELLAFLMQHPGRVLPRQMLLDSVWGKDKAVYERTLDVHIRKIREKLGHYGSHIKTMKRVGYKFSMGHN